MAKSKSKPVASKKTSAAARPGAKGTGGKNRLPADKAPKKKASKIDWAKIKRDVDRELLTAYRSLRLAMFAEADAKEAHKEATKWAELKQIEVNGLVEKLEQIQKGTYQPGLWDQKLPTKNGKAETNGHAAPASTAVDEGAKMPLSALLEHKDKDGKPFLTASKVDKIKEIVGATIGDLEKFQKENSFDWAKKIKGLGEQGLDKLQDAHLAFRSKHPIPNVVLTASEKAAKGAESTTERAGRQGAEAALAKKDRTNPYPDAGPEQTAWFAEYDKVAAGPGKEPEAAKLQKALDKGLAAEGKANNLPVEESNGEVKPK